MNSGERRLAVRHLNCPGSLRFHSLDDACSKRFCVRLPFPDWQRPPHSRKSNIESAGAGWRYSHAVGNPGFNKQCHHRVSNRVNPVDDASRLTVIAVNLNSIRTRPARSR